MTTQVEVILEYLKRHPITSKEAIKYFGVTRLSDVIFKLRRRGLNIITEMVTVTTRYGNVEVARYHLKGKS
jgi:hypothetical protein